MPPVVSLLVSGRLLLLLSLPTGYLHATILYAMLQAENVMSETKSAVYTVVEREIQHIDTGEEHLIVTRVIFGT